MFQNSAEKERKEKKVTLDGRCNFFHQHSLSLQRNALRLQRQSLSSSLSPTLTLTVAVAIVCRYIKSSALLIGTFLCALFSRSAIEVGIMWSLVI
ncbi:unnamed protein product [Ceratitis capitata]|uniref:(Mediterranean fruit fly) hypothetical protein n=1 Tax=Ceratitis capitata TaxID=7213 RepID=A0A811UQ01_CERCA|nr:unnamed protein product [Ceratitis capitata]